MVKVALKSFWLLFFLMFFCSFMYGQVQDSILTDSEPLNNTSRADTSQESLKEKKDFFRKIFPKKDTIKAEKQRSPVVIAARKAAMRSLIIPGFGQVTNIMSIKEDKERLKIQGKSFALKKIFIISKIAGIYAAESLLVYSYLTNKKDIGDFNTELDFRSNNNGNTSPNGIYKEIQTTVLQAAKSNAIRNRDVSTFGFIAVHALNVIDAYIDARLRFFNVDDDLSFRITPTIIHQNSNWMTQSQVYPALKIALKL